LGIVGFADDRAGLRPIARLALQILISAFLLPLLLHGMGLDHWWTWVFAVGVVAWTAVYVNAFNFMDGINGIAVAQTTVGGLGLVLMGVRWSSVTVSILGIAITGAAVGFAPYNVVLARLFLGDVGSYFIGGWLAATTVVALRAGIPPEVVIAPFLVYLVDTGSTLWRRWRRGDSLLTAHRGHAYQRLAQIGWSHSAVSLMAATAMTLTTVIAVAAAKSPLAARVVATTLTVAIAGGFALLPTLLHSSRERVRA
jgi:UDP-N-acetylmuramyl pentapeptide phosphotransferase/UDP-N-acetylglucosamine-1-phosphate transferase